MSFSQGKKSPRIRICNAIFVAKAIFAVCLGCTALGLNGYKVYDLYAIQQRIINQRTQPVTINPLKCLAPTKFAKLEPPSQTMMVGFSLDWINQLPPAMMSIVGFQPAVINAYLTLDPSKTPCIDVPLLEWHGQQVQLTGGILAVTMQPLNMSSITDAQYQLLAQECFHINSAYGVPIMLRYGHEMNGAKLPLTLGDWPQYGLQPTGFIASFRKVATAVQALTNMTAMVFGPNNGVNYPFTSPDALVTLPTASSNPADFAALDTNKDGVIDNLDDPYLPYYPGDDFVDWVALSQYWYPDVGTGFNIVPPSTYFVDQITATGPTMALSNEPRNGDPTRNFYQVFVVNHNKPMMIPETSAPFTPNMTGPATNTQIKQAWYQEILSLDTQTRMNRLKLVVHFEIDKMDGSGNMQEWRVTSHPDVLSSFLGVLKDKRAEISYATDFKVDCGGNWIHK